MSRNAKWTEAEDKVIADNYPNMDAKEVGKMIGRTEGAVKRRASVLHVQKSREWKAAHKAENTKRMRNWVL